MATYWKVTHRGTMPSGEAFAHSHHMEASDAATMSGAVTGVTDSRTACFTSAYLGHYSNKISWSQADVYQVDINSDAAIDHGVATGSFTGTISGGSQVPTEVAVVLSLRTAVLLRRGRGRMYLPTLTVGDFDNDGLILSAARTAITTAWKAYFDHLTATGFTVSVRGLSTPGPGHVMRRITSIDCGNVADSQRRRRNKITETRTSVALL